LVALGGREEASNRRGADLLLQVRRAVTNGAFGHAFGHLFVPTPNTVKQLPLAA
jgi:hypothetical protein